MVMVSYLGAMKYLVILLVFGLCPMKFCWAQEELMDNPAADYEQNASIDEIMMGVEMEGIIDKFIELLKNPRNISNYIQEDEIAGSVKVEGDMLFTEEQFLNIKFLKDNEDNPDSSKRSKRKAIKNDRYRWPNNQVPYRMARGAFSASDVQVIRNAMAEWERETCLKFSQAPASSRSHMYFRNGGGCSSFVGRIGRQQAVTLAPGCRRHGIVVHEIGHAIGFQHEQTRPDRNTYVTIHEANIRTGAEFNFQRYSWSSIIAHEVPYDYLSVMHYGHFAFSKNRQPTISVKNSKYQNKIGNRRGLSFRDIKLANIMYQCSAQCSKSLKCPGEGFMDKTCKCKCPGNPIKDCNAVGTAKPTVRPRTTPRPVTIRTPRPTGSCEDTSAYCKYWTIGPACNLFYPTMSKICRKSCKLCRTIAGFCRDKRRLCGYWKARKFCNHPKYSSYMTRYCARSCNRCKSSNIVEGFKDGKCSDEAALCRLFSVIGYCELKRAWMMKNCVSTCGFC